MDRQWKVREFGNYRNRACFTLGLTSPATVERIEVKGAEVLSVECGLANDGGRPVYRQLARDRELEPKQLVKPNEPMYVLVDASPLWTDVSVTWFLSAPKRPHPMAEWVLQ